MKTSFLFIILIINSVFVYSQDTLDSIKNVIMGTQIDEIELSVSLGIEESKKYSEKLVSLAESGNAAAQFRLGQSYMLGIGIDKDINKAIIWISKAAQMHNHNALCHLGYYYENGMGVQKDEFQAYSFYKKAALKGHPDAASFLANCYLNGIGTVPDTLKARAWYEKCAENGDYVAQNNTGQLYYIAHDYEKAIYWLTKASRKSKNASEQLGYMYENGIGTDKDPQKAKEFYRKSYELGNISVKDKIQ